MVASYYEVIAIKYVGLLHRVATTATLAPSMTPCVSGKVFAAAAVLYICCRGVIVVFCSPVYDPEADITIICNQSVHNRLAVTTYYNLFAPNVNFFDDSRKSIFLPVHVFVSILGVAAPSIEAGSGCSIIHNTNTDTGSAGFCESGCVSTRSVETACGFVWVLVACFAVHHTYLRVMWWSEAAEWPYCR